MDLLVAPLLAGVVLVEAGKVAVIALVQRLVAGDDEIVDARFLKDQVERVLGALEGGGIVKIGLIALGLDELAGGAGFGDALFRQVRVLPAGEQVLEVPFALSVTDENECASHWGRSLQLEAEHIGH